MKFLLYVFTLTFSQILSLHISDGRGSNENNTLNITPFENADHFIQNLTNHFLNNYQKHINQKFNSVNRRFVGFQKPSNNDTVQKCVSRKQLSQSLKNEINEQIKKCATVVIAEYTNVITNSYNSAQAFMSFSSLIFGEIQKCGLNETCRWLIVMDAIKEAGQLPPKIFSLTAKIQNLVLQTINSLNSCSLEGLKKITTASLDLAEEVFYCILDETNRNNCTSLN